MSVSVEAYGIEHTTNWKGTKEKTFFNRGYPCFGLAAIFAGMLYSVQIIQKSSTRNIMHVNIIVLKLPANLHGVVD